MKGYGEEMEKDWLQGISEEVWVQKLVETNEFTGRYGLTLSEQDAKLLLKGRQESLKAQRRVEFGEGILPKLIFCFCDSPYISQEDYAETIRRLQEIFYFYKNESLDMLTDEELLGCMREKFDGECHGELDYLEDTILDELGRDVRGGRWKVQDLYIKDEE